MCSTQHSNMRRWAAAPDYFYLLHLTPASHGMHACWCTRRLIAVINGESSLQNSVVRSGEVRFRFIENSVKLQGHQAGPYNFQSVLHRHNHDITTLDGHQP